MKVYIEAIGSHDWIFKADDMSPYQPHIARLAMRVVATDETTQIDIVQHFNPFVLITDAARARLNRWVDSPIDFSKENPFTRQDGEALLAQIEAAGVIVAHAAVFARKLVRVSLFRVGLLLPDNLPWFDTMTQSTEICKIAPKNGRGASKWPSVDEAFDFFWPGTRGSIEWADRDRPVGPHNAGIRALDRLQTIHMGIRQWRGGSSLTKAEMPF